MATFEARINGLTGLTIGTSPTQAQVSEYLKDGVIEITNRIIALRPEEAENFQKSISSDAQGVEIGRSQILSVIREASADGSSDGSTAWRPCRKISASLQSRVVDIDSLSYASIYNPAYAIDNGVVNVYPIPSANNGIKIYHINITPVNGSGASLAHNHDDILYFPVDKIYLVVLYAGIRSLTKALADINISAFSASSVPPSTIPSPAISSPGISSTLVSISGDVPTYTLSSSVPNFADADNLINTEEDPELAAVRVQTIGQELVKYRTDITDQLNKFQQESTVYAADIQKALKQADADMQEAIKEADLTLQASLQDYTLELQKYSAEVQKYQMDIQKEVAEHKEETIEKTYEYQWMALRLQNLTQEYNTAFGIQAPKQQASATDKERQGQRR